MIFYKFALSHWSYGSLETSLQWYGFQNVEYDLKLVLEVLVKYIMS
jgi:hypothetical protein